ncbi:bleomycin resistance protein [Streptomyces iconiensis]|uniref:VOC family protein n=1 Tax=Streptomyces iconiensis TaxID=1384038 RepID=A0ABT6ZN73_9ACTN|nr:VOC family protein [Streptomyces iconiensis]MDJ1130493.1 VOC family protein [Streptomyces iconiensis]
MSEKTVPILPCPTLQPVLDFYRALAFEVTFQQKSPNPYAVVERGGIQLHFFGMKHYDPSASYSTCCVQTDNVDALHTAFRAGLKAAYGRIPTRGLPRIGALADTSHGMRQFLMSDPGGNCLRIAQPLSEEQHHRPPPRGTFARALHHAALFADSKDDATSAAKVLDRALNLTDEQPAPEELLRLLVLRADVAGRLGDDATAAGALTRASALPLTDGQRDSARDALDRLAELRADGTLTGKDH